MKRPKHHTRTDPLGAQGPLGIEPKWVTATKGMDQ
jgi:hypothetical protein